MRKCFEQQLPQLHGDIPGLSGSAATAAAASLICSLIRSIKRIVSVFSSSRRPCAGGLFRAFSMSRAVQSRTLTPPIFWSGGALTVLAVTCLCRVRIVTPSFLAASRVESRLFHGWFARLRKRVALSIVLSLSPTRLQMRFVWLALTRPSRVSDIRAVRKHFRSLGVPMPFLAISRAVAFGVFSICLLLCWCSFTHRPISRFGSRDNGDAVHNALHNRTGERGRKAGKVRRMAETRKQKGWKENVQFVIDRSPVQVRTSAPSSHHALEHPPG